MNSEEMPLQTPRKLEINQANFTNELSFLIVSLAMLLHTKWQFITMSSKMIAQTDRLPEVSRANFTLERAIITVNL